MHSPSAETILSEAVALPAAADRAAYLDRACGGDPALRARLERLVDNHFRAGSFLEQPPVAPPPPDETAAYDPVEGGPAIGSRIGPYALREQIGEGGMGLVFVADQTEPVRRRVALKVIKPGMDTREVVARFEAERQALALMDHPNIARVLDAGATPEGRPFFVMELVRGTPITEYCDEHRMSVRQRLELFLQVCSAVQHAHQKGVIHRDLKPSNVLVAVHDVAAVVKVIDFGIAKAVGQSLTDKTVYTAVAQVVGTPMYMSPEQAGQSALDIDTRTDVYSLGVLLYELLAGVTPFDGDRLRAAGLDEFRRIVREEEPARPSTRMSTLAAAARSTVATRRQANPRRLTGELKGDLDWVVMKCLEKDRERRYESVGALAADVRRHLADEPVEAHPPKVVYRLGKFALRHRVGLGVTGLAAAVVLIMGWAAADWGGRRATTGRVVDEALAESAELQGLGKYTEALQAARRAEGLAAGGTASGDARHRAQRRRADLELLLRMDEIRLEKASSVRNRKFDTELTDRRYGEEFRAAGIDVDALPAEVAARLVRDTVVPVEFAAVLDGWALDRRSARGKGDAGWRHLLEVSRLVDPDPWRCRLRDALGNLDRDALVELSRSADVHLQPASAAASLGQGLMNAGATGRAAEFLRAAQIRHPADFWVNYWLGWALKSSSPRQASEIVRFFSVALSLRPDSPGAWTNLGIELNGCGRLDEAIAAYREAIRLNPNHSTAHCNLAFVLVNQGRAGEAETAAREALRLDPNSSIAHVNLGMALKALGRADEAIAAYREAIRTAVEYQEEIGATSVSVVARTNLGAVLCDLKHDFEGAVAYFDEALRVDPNYSNAHFNRGVALSKLGRWPEAAAAYGEAARLRPNALDIHRSTASAWFRADDAKRTAAAFREVVRLKPDDVMARTYLALLLAGNPEPAMRNPVEAVIHAQWTIALEPEIETGWRALGIARFRLGEWRAATEALTRASRLKGGDNTLGCFYLAMAHWQLGERGEARRWYAKGAAHPAANDPDDVAHRNLRSEAAELLGILAPPPRPSR